jgi:hypothetical protein
MAECMPHALASIFLHSHVHVRRVKCSTGDITHAFDNMRRDIHEAYDGLDKNAG